MILNKFCSPFTPKGAPVSAMISKLYDWDLRNIANSSPKMTKRQSMHFVFLYFNPGRGFYILNGRGNFRKLEKEKICARTFVYLGLISDFDNGGTFELSCLLIYPTIGSNPKSFECQRIVDIVCR